MKDRISYEQLRPFVNSRNKSSGCIRVERAPLIHAGFPGTFNLSFTEYHWLKEYGRHVDFDHDFTFSTIQSCIRPDDIPLIGTEKLWKYLGVFEMADLNGTVALRNKSYSDKSHKEQVSDLVSFLGMCGISSEKIYPSYCSGGSVKELTNGKYSFDLNIEEDKDSVEGFLSAGVSKNNLISDKSKDTFLSVNLRKEEQNLGVSLAYNGWGYRNEINVLMPNGKLLDIGTLERFVWRPVYEGDRIVGLGDITCDFSIGAIGLERLCMVANELPRIQDIDCIKPIYDAMEKRTGERDYLAGESLRALHRIYSDIAKFSIKNIGRHRRNRMNKISKNIPENYGPAFLKELLQVHSEIQPWHSEIVEGIEPTLEGIERNRQRK